MPRKPRLVAPRPTTPSVAHMRQPRGNGRPSKTATSTKAAPARTARIVAKVKCGEYCSPAVISGKQTAHRNMARTIFVIVVGDIGISLFRSEPARTAEIFRLANSATNDCFISYLMIAGQFQTAIANTLPTPCVTRNGAFATIRWARMGEVTGRCVSRNLTYLKTDD